MYKSKLQVLCHQRSWNLPEFTTVKDGPDHNPRFTATVMVNGVPFQTPDECRSSKEAQNQAAKVAFNYFTAPKITPRYVPKPPPNSPLPQSSGFSTSNTNLDARPAIGGVLQQTQQENVQTSQANGTPLGLKDDKSCKEMLHLFKSRLQQYAQKRNLTLPMYSVELDGPPHARRFRSRVAIDGKTYESLEFFSTLKEAEHAAAKVAFESLLLDEAQEDESLYKSLLQELAQKEGFNFPAYHTANSGPPHIPTFVSTVEIEGETFLGQEAKTKKQAEMSAAKAAYTGLTEHRASQNPTVCSSGCRIKGLSKVSSSSLQSIITDALQLNVRPKANLIIHEEQAEEDRGRANQNPTILSPGLVKEALKVSSSSSQSIVTDDLQQNGRLKAKLTVHEEQDAENRDGHQEKLSKLITVNAKVSTHRSPPSAYSTNSVLESDIETQARESTLPSSKVLVFPRQQNMTFPDGATVFPFSDDKWVAVRVPLNQNQ